MGKKLATDCILNRRIKVAGPRPVIEEAEMAIRKGIIIDKVDEYIKNYCNIKGKQIKNNLSKEGHSSLKGLIKRVREGEIMICQSDKGKQ